MENIDCWDNNSLCQAFIFKKASESRKGSCLALGQYAYLNPGMYALYVSDAQAASGEWDLECGFVGWRMGLTHPRKVTHLRWGGGIVSPTCEIWGLLAARAFVPSAVTVMASSYKAYRNNVAFVY